MDLLRHQKCLVIPLDKAQHVHHHLRESFPKYPELPRPTSFHIAVVQQSFYEEELTIASQPKDEMEEGTHPPMDSQGQSDSVSQLDRVTCELREYLEHERDGRLDFLGNVNRLISDREKDRADYAFAQLANKR